MISLIKDLIVYRQVIICFREILNNAVIAEKYKLTTGKKREENLKMTKFGILYMYVPIPQKLEASEHDVFLDGHMQLLNEAFISLGLMSAIKMDVRIFREAVEIKEDEEIMRYIYLLKFRPIIRRGSVVKALAWVSAAVIAFFYFKSDIMNLISNI